MRYKLNRKGNIDDMWIVLPFMLIIAVIMILGSFVFDSFNTKLSGMSNVDATTKSTINTYNSNLTKSFDYGFIFILIGLPIISIIFARLIPSSPFFYAITIIVNLFIWALAILLAYIYRNIILTSSSLYTHVYTNLPFINFFMPKLVFYAIIYSSVVSIVLYTKTN